MVKIAGKAGVKAVFLFLLLLISYFFISPAFSADDSGDAAEFFKGKIEELVTYLKDLGLLPKRTPSEGLEWKAFVTFFFSVFILLRFVFRLPALIAGTFALFAASAILNYAVLPAEKTNELRTEDLMAFGYKITAMVLIYLIVDFITMFMWGFSPRTKEWLKITITALGVMFFENTVLGAVKALIDWTMGWGLAVLLVFFVITRIFMTLLGIMNTRAALQARLAGAYQVGAAYREIKRRREAIQEVFRR